MGLFVFILLAVLCGWLIYKFGKHFKRVRLDAFTMFTGGVKCGKSTVSFNVAYRQYKRNLRAWRIRSIMNPGNKREKPLFYSNIPLAVEFVPLTEELLLREKRFNYKSVCFIDEASLVADSMSWKNEEVNERLRDFTKLFGHETQGGSLIVNTHCIGDLHYAFKRTTSSYYYVDKLVKWIPFFLVAHIIEQRYSEDGSVVAVDTTDISEKMRWYVFPKKTWKMFDCYAFSKITDNLQIENHRVHTDYLKTDKIIRFRSKK